MAKRFNYGKLQGTATRLLDRFQQGVVQLIVPGEPVPGPEPWDPPTEGEPAVHALKAAVAAVTVDQANAKYIDGTVITTADLVVTCSVPPVVPDLQHVLTIDGEARTIKKIVQVPSAGVPVAFKLFVQG
jgi:glutathione S-transferase